MKQPEPDNWCGTCGGKCHHAFRTVNGKRYCSKRCMDEAGIPYNKKDGVQAIKSPC